MFKKIFEVVVLPMLMLLGFIAQAHAAIDTADVLTGITDAQTAILAVIGGLLALSVAIFGIMKVYRFVSGRAGA